jgi:small subunit ribosomal protein S15
MVGKIALMRGRSQSTRPISKRPPNWVVYQQDEVKALIINLAREGISQSEIGALLRDEYGIPLVKPIVGEGVFAVLMEAEIAPKIPEDIYNLMIKATRLRRHIERNPKDFSNKRILQNTASKIYALTRYYKKKGLLPQDWRYRDEIVTI